MMIRLFQYFTLYLFVAACAPAESTAQTVYITKTGAKYHRSTCRYLKYSSLSVSLADAKKNGYTPCSVCSPGTVTEKPVNNTMSKSKSDSNNSYSNKADTLRVVQGGESSSVQCSGITKAGNRCKRSTTNANGRCYQHQ